jgi:hypothetical protein
MASYALIPALSGFVFDATKGLIGFRPRTFGLGGAFHSIWSLDSGWGKVEAEKERLTVTLLGGELLVKEIAVSFAKDAKRVTVDGKEITFEAGEGSLTLKQAVVCKKTILVE